MASGRPTLKVDERSEFGSRTTRRLRRDGLVPGIVYADGEAARPFQVNARDIAAFLGEGHTLFDLEIEGASSVPVVVKDEQRHPVRGELMHIDCHEVKLDVKIQADVTITLEGTEEAPGVKEGGILEHVTREITIEALPTAIPEEITVDVSEMIIGDTVQLSAISAPEGVEFTADAPDEVTIATLNPPRIEEEPEPDVEEDPELVGEEGEEPAEGEESEGGEEGGEPSGDGSEGDDGGE
jgi:large subunit ribosomal protein L25